MARWNARIKKQLKVKSSELEKGVYIATDLFHDFLSWLEGEKFEKREGDPGEGPIGDADKERVLVSPDGKWLVMLRETEGDFVFLQLKAA